MENQPGGKSSHLYAHAKISDENVNYCHKIRKYLMTQKASTHFHLIFISSKAFAIFYFIVQKPNIIYGVSTFLQFASNHEALKHASSYAWSTLSVLQYCIIVFIAPINVNTAIVWSHREYCFCHGKCHWNLWQLFFSRNWLYKFATQYTILVVHVICSKSIREIKALKCYESQMKPKAMLQICFNFAYWLLCGRLSNCSQ